MSDSTPHIDPAGNVPDQLATAISHALDTGVFVAAVNSDVMDNVAVSVGSHGVPPEALVTVADIILRNVISMTMNKHCDCEPCRKLIVQARAAVTALGLQRIDRGTIN